MTAVWMLFVSVWFQAGGGPVHINMASVRKCLFVSYQVISLNSPLISISRLSVSWGASTKYGGSERIWWLWLGILGDSFLFNGTGYTCINCFLKSINPTTIFLQQSLKAWPLFWSELRKKRNKEQNWQFKLFHFYTYNGCHVCWLAWFRFTGQKKSRLPGLDKAQAQAFFSK